MFYGKSGKPGTGYSFKNKLVKLAHASLEKYSSDSNVFAYKKIMLM